MFRRTAVISTGLALSLLVLNPGPSVQAQVIPRPTSYTLPGEAVFPEGVAFSVTSGDFFVTSTTDGTIFRGNVQQTAAEVFLPGGSDGRTTAVGIKVDDRRNRLFIAGGNTGQIFVYGLDGTLQLQFDNQLSTTFINDAVVTPDGDAYFTDSLSPVLYRVATRGLMQVETWLNFTNTPLVYQQGFNVNGIAASPDGRYLVVIQSNTGKLFRIDTTDKSVVEINLGGATLTNGDGLIIVGNQTLYVARNLQELIVKVELSEDYATGEVISSITYTAFGYPTTIARARDRLLVVNSQFDARSAGQPPQLPFTVSAIRLP